MLTVKDRKFYLDGEEFVIHSASVHYFRALPEYWRGIMQKAVAAGLNTVETYVCWNLHEPHKGEFDFSGRLDIEKFIETADELGLKVIIRIGPFICAEWDNGGLPPWLLSDERIRMRCCNKLYLDSVKDFFSVLLPKLKRHIDNDGPVIALAVENEYGSYGDDFEYLAEIEKMYKEYELNCLYISADGAGDYYLSTGSNPGIVKCLDFGVMGNLGIEQFKVVDKYEKDNPYMAAEYWAGTFTHWKDEKCNTVDDDKAKQDYASMLDISASFNIYMFFGGTNFGFTAGANTHDNNADGNFQPDITSYDYDAALTEWGEYTKKYYDLREVMQKHYGKTLPEPPASPKLQNIGTVRLTEFASLWDNMSLGTSVKSKTAECMEYYGQNCGYILYKKTMSYDIPINGIMIGGLHDRAHVFFNGEYVATRMRSYDESAVGFSRNLKKGDVIEILVENMGHVNFGMSTYRGDRKGITDAVYATIVAEDGKNYGSKLLFDWEVTSFEMEDISKVDYRKKTKAEYPAFLRGKFSANSKEDCFVYLPDFKKGIVFVNGFNLGRYWEEGPQDALYLPGALLEKENEIVIFETDGIKGEPEIEINDKCMKR